ncbi:hypothetical protein [Aquimarina sp. AU474]|uniref:hypothetical protein n=1 Tax=Aquimarina sp. AU474 TaxID=2108529 RepID=UPI00190F9BD9|nr:hypothetical protein [Aquimarina sp. AU474]
MNCLKYLFSILFFCIAITHVKSQTPTPPNGKKWAKVNELSDEFNGNSLDGNKWVKSSRDWIGRPPRLFKEN